MQALDLQSSRLHQILQRPSHDSCGFQDGRRMLEAMAVVLAVVAVAVMTTTVIVAIMGRIAEWQ